MSVQRFLFYATCHKDRFCSYLALNIVRQIKYIAIKVKTNLFCQHLYAHIFRNLVTMKTRDKPLTKIPISSMMPIPHKVPFYLKEIHDLTSSKKLL